MKKNIQKLDLDELKTAVRNRKRKLIFMRIHLVIWFFLLIYFFQLSMGVFLISLGFFVLNVFVHIKEGRNLDIFWTVLGSSVGFFASCAIELYYNGINPFILGFLISPIVISVCFDSEELDLLGKAKPNKENVPFLRSLLDAKAYEVYIEAVNLNYTDDSLTRLYELLDIFKALDKDSPNYQKSRAELIGLMLEVISDLQAEGDRIQAELDKGTNVYNESLVDEAKRIMKG